jgi:AraC-like DNA-binding protein
LVAKTALPICGCGSVTAAFVRPTALLVPLLPQVVLAREPRLATRMQLVGDETRARRPGRDLVLERLLEVLLIGALRCATATASMPGLARGLADDRLVGALCALHKRPEYPWTVVKLAAQAALSRSAFFARFSRDVGLPPMVYLLTWRMALAKRLLCEHELSMDEVAERVGYSAASTFCIAFARHSGAAAARYARDVPQRRPSVLAASNVAGRPIWRGRFCALMAGIAVMPSTAFTSQQQRVTVRTSTTTLDSALDRATEPQLGNGWIVSTTSARTWLRQPCLSHRLSTSSSIAISPHVARGTRSARLL